MLKEFTRTIRIPVHYSITKSKINKLNKITAKLTYAIKLFSDKIKETSKTSRKELSRYEKEIQKTTKLSSAYVQQAKDKAIWVWKSYNKLHKKWGYKLKRTSNEKYYNKLLKRKPSEPFSKANNNISARLDYRTISIISNLDLKGKPVKQIKKNTNLTNLWAKISTLKKHNKIMIPLNPAEYHIKKLKQSSKITDAELTRKNNKLYLSITCSYKVPQQEIRSIRAIDLGISRSITAVLLEPGKELNKNSFLIIKEGKKKQKINYYDSLIGNLQEQKNYKLLKRIREKRKNFIEDSERKLAKYISSISNNSLVGIGYPKGIKYKNYKGNGNKMQRKRLNKWSYNRLINYTMQKCQENGIEAARINESYTSRICSNCRSRNTERPYNNNWSLFHCNDCGITLNSDINASINMAIRTINYYHGIMLDGRQVSFSQLASDEHALTADDNLKKGLSAETHKALRLDAQGFLA